MLKPPKKSIRLPPLPLHGARTSGEVPRGVETWGRGTEAIVAKEGDSQGRGGGAKSRGTVMIINIVK